MTEDYREGMTGGSREERLSGAFVDLADTLVDDFDVLDFLHSLATHCIALLDVDAAGLMLADSQGACGSRQPPASRCGCSSCSSCRTTRGRASTASRPVSRCSIETWPPTSHRVAAVRRRGDGRGLPLGASPCRCGCGTRRSAP